MDQKRIGNEKFVRCFEARLGKMTVKTYSDPKQSNKAYSIESVEVKSLEETKVWLDKSVKADGYEKPATVETNLAGGANAVKNSSPLAQGQCNTKASTPQKNSRSAVVSKQRLFLPRLQS